MSETEFTVEDCLRSEEECRVLLEGRRRKLGERVMDIKAQVVADFVASIRKPGYFPPLPELRGQLVKMVELLDEPEPVLERVEDVETEGGVRIRLYGGGGGDAPIFVYYHGGGWVQGGWDTHGGLCARLSRDTGVMVASVDYRLAPEHPFPAGLEDAWGAYEWARSEAGGGEKGGDVGRVCVGGDSAGGNFAAVVCQEAKRRGFLAPDFQVLIYPSVDMKGEYRSRGELFDGPVIPADRMAWYREQYFRGCEEGVERDVRASPMLEGDLRGLPRALVITGGFDPLRDEGCEYASRLRESGVDVTYHEYVGVIHAFLQLTRAIPAGGEATREIGDYVRRCFGLGG